MFVFHWYDCVSTVMWVHVVSEGSVRSSLTLYMNHRWIAMCGVVDVTSFGCVDIYRDVWCCRCNNGWLC